MPPSNYQTICEKITKIDKRIIFSAVISDNGKILAGGLCPGVEPFDTPQEDERLFTELELRAKMRKEFDRQLGPVLFTMAIREKMTELSVPLNKDILYVITTSDYDYSKLTPKVLKIVENQS